MSSDEDEMSSKTHLETKNRLAPFEQKGCELVRMRPALINS